MEPIWRLAISGSRGKENLCCQEGTSDAYELNPLLEMNIMNILNPAKAYESYK